MATVRANYSERLSRKNAHVWLFAMDKHIHHIAIVSIAIGVGIMYAQIAYW